MLAANIQQNYGIANTLIRNVKRGDQTKGGQSYSFGDRLFLCEFFIFAKKNRSYEILSLLHFLHYFRIKILLD